MKLDKLFGSLQAFEMNTTKPKKEKKDLAFKVESDEQTDDDDIVSLSKRLDQLIKNKEWPSKPKYQSHNKDREDPSRHNKDGPGNNSSKFKFKVFK